MPEHQLSHECPTCNTFGTMYCLQRGGHHKPMPPAEVLDRAAAFDPTPAAMITPGPMDPEIRLHIRAADGPEATASFTIADVEMCRWVLAELTHQRKAAHHAAIMRLALEMIMRQSVNCLITPENKAAYNALSDYGKGRLQGLYELRRVAEQALKECA